VVEQEFDPAKFGDVLNVCPAERDPAAVREAMEWWLRGLPTSGFELAPELQAENWALFEVFLSGRLATCTRNQVVQEEGEEVKHYTIILFGQCRLRCAKPAVGVAPVVPCADSTKDDQKCDRDAFIHIETLGRGESFGLMPGDPRSPYNITCSDKTMLLRLSAPDYDATLRPFHKEFFQRTVDFLQRHNICPEAGSAQLKKIAPFLRQRRIPRGQTFMHSGEFQRHMYFLREGACSVLVHDGPNGLSGMVPRDEEEDEEDEEVDKHDQFLRMRATSYGGRMQQAAAFDSHRREVVKGMARGPLRQTLSGKSGQAFKASDGDLHASSMLSEPGVMLGEEALVHDNLRDWVNLRNCYSVRASRNCYFFVADISAFKLFNTYMGSRGLTQMISDKMTRRCKQFTRGLNVAQRINKRAQDIKANEFAKESRQKIRLPLCAGYPAVDELENIEDYLDVVFEHRKPPPNTQLPSLTCLEGTVYGPKTANGPGVSAMLKCVAEDGAGCVLRTRSSPLLRDWRDGSSYDENPMGGTVSTGARYSETSPRGFREPLLAIGDDSSPKLKALSRGDSMPQLSDVGWGGGVFLNTEVDFEDGMTISLQSHTLATSASLPDLYTAHQNSSVDGNSKQLVSDTSTKASRSDARSLENKRKQRVIKAFSKVIVGKSVLILTDKKDLQKQISRVLLKDGTSISFIKSTNDLWQRLRDGKEQYDMLLIDLTKAELQIEPMLRTIRSQEKYQHLPIIVLSLDRELPEVVRNSCSFVVFLPLAPQMLREALVWCFDRKSIQKQYQSEESLELEVVKGKASMSEYSRALVTSGSWKLSDTQGSLALAPPAC
jgi:CheY-like chemotaxis protein